jgi:hypothetical protein
MRTPFLLLAGMAAGICSSCVERINVRPDDHAPRLIIVAMLGSDTAQQVVTITKSVNYFGVDTCPSVSTAEVYLNDERLALLDTGRGTYGTRPDFAVAPGATYRLRVRYNGAEYWAEDVAPHHMFMPENLPAQYASLLPDEMRTFITPINLDGDTTRYAPPFLLSSVIVREDGGDHSIRFSRCYNGRKEVASMLDVVLAISDAQNILPMPTLALITSRSRFVLEGSEMDTLLYCPFDTVGIRAHSMTEATHRYVSSARAESQSNTPMFGGAPANVEGNIQGEGALGIFGLYTSSPPVSVVLPMNAKTLDNENPWVNLRDTSLHITIHDEGEATYTSPDSLWGRPYFTGLRVDPRIKGFRASKAYGAGGLVPSVRFRMKSYVEFWEIPDHPGGDTVKWQLGRRSDR